MFNLPPTDTRLLSPLILIKVELFVMSKSEPMLIRLFKPVSSVKSGLTFITNFPPIEVMFSSPCKLVMLLPDITTSPSISIQPG